jgi:hypothetical protein
MGVSTDAGLLRGCCKRIARRVGFGFRPVLGAENGPGNVTAGVTLSDFAGNTRRNDAQPEVGVRVVFEGVMCAESTF